MARLSTTLYSAPQPTATSHIVVQDCSDEVSLCSTQTVNALQHAKLPVSINNDKPSRKRVRFAKESHNVYHKNAQVHKKDVQALWFQDRDYAFFKSNYKNEVGDIIFTENALRQGAKNSRNKSSSSKSYIGVLQRVYNKCQSISSQDCGNGNDMTSFLSTEDREDLAHVISLTGRFGLEKAAVRVIRKDRMARRRAVVDAVLSLQNAQESDAVLRLASRDISQASRLFAVCLAQTEQEERTQSQATQA